MHCVLSLTLALTAQPAETATPAPCPPAQVQVSAVDALLDAIEKSDAAVMSISADILYDRVFEIQGDRQIRTGKLYVADRRTPGSPVPARVIGARFESLQVGERFTPEIYHVIFDGAYLVERWPGQKQFVKTQLVRAGEVADALRVGKNPLPLPIGQKKADLLARYIAETPAAKEGAVGNVEAETPKIAAFIAGTRQLKLTVRPELVSTEELHEIRVWYKPEGDLLLPRLVRAVNRAGDVSLIQLINVRANQPIPDEGLDMTSPTDGWNVQVRELPPPSTGTP
ncbi:MAG: hypothetical protein HBSAPP03_11540 [Phycisphaerae bacterium]|nr:MAG: hypothetical protein HBSAPP03_11540 [Phycisphaerae bacterium]